MLTAPRAAIYVRISDDREGAGLGVRRQEEDCRLLAATQAWSVVDVISDNDLSAYSGKPRPGYRRLLDSLRAGHLDAVVVWHADRLHRSPVELEEFIGLCEERGTRVETVRAGRVDFATPSGRMVARMLGTAARYESEHKADRIRRKAEELALAGKVSGGGTRPYGYADDRVTVVEDEAEVIRECARRVLAGEPLGALVTELNARGIPTVTGKAWQNHTLKRVLTSARISGQREHHPLAAGRPRAPGRGEIRADAVWPAIISKADTARLRDALANPSRARVTPARTYLLTGLLSAPGAAPGWWGVLVRTARPATSARRSRGRTGVEGRSSWPPRWRS
jgi:site-specific DNA recombinase